MKGALLIAIITVIVSFAFYMFGLMKLVPIYFTAPPLFLSILITIQLWSNRNRFRGFKKKKKFSMK